MTVHEKSRLASRKHKIKTRSNTFTIKSPKTRIKRCVKFDFPGVKLDENRQGILGNIQKPKNIDKDV